MFCIQVKFCWTLFFTSTTGEVNKHPSGAQVAHEIKRCVFCTSGSETKIVHVCHLKWSIVQPVVLFVNPLTPRVKPWVIQSSVTFNSMDRILKCDHSLESC